MRASADTRGVANLAMQTAPRRRLGVVVIDPLPVVRAGLRLLIDHRPDMEVVVEAGDSEAALVSVSRLRRTRIVCLVALGLHGERDAFWLIRTMRERFPSLTILGMGSDAAPGDVSRALFVGADGFVDKNIDPTEFLTALREGAAGKTVLRTPRSVHPGDVARAMDRHRKSARVLTERERQVLSLASEGLTAREIARRLDVRERTVTTHLSRIYGKLGVANRISAVRQAARAGLVSIRPE
jgi:DNA-binding NarL/FixJ family response regulator